MTNKMPEIMKQYKNKYDGFLYKIDHLCLVMVGGSEFVSTDFHRIGEDGRRVGGKSILIATDGDMSEFWHYYEELSSETKEEPYDFVNTKSFLDFRGDIDEEIIYPFRKPRKEPKLQEEDKVQAAKKFNFTCCIFNNEGGLRQYFKLKLKNNSQVVIKIEEGSLKETDRPMIEKSIFNPAPFDVRCTLNIDTQEIIFTSGSVAIEEKPKSIWKSVEELPDSSCDLLLRYYGSEVLIGFYKNESSKQGETGFYFRPRLRQHYELASIVGLSYCRLRDYINHIESLEERINALEEK